MLGNDASVRGDDAQVGSPGPQCIGHVRRFQTFGLIDRTPALDVERLHRCVANLLSPPTRPVWLGDYACYRMRGVEQTPQGGHRELRRPEEHHYHLPARESFLILRTIRSF